MAKSDKTLIKNLKNLGPKSAKMLAKAGIHQPDQLFALGSVAAYLAVKHSGQNPSLNLLWAIEGALGDVHWLELEPKLKEKLRKEIEELCP